MEVRGIVPVESRLRADSADGRQAGPGDGAGAGGPRGRFQMRSGNQSGRRQRSGPWQDRDQLRPTGRD
jgi:hypothetical protein